MLKAGSSSPSTSIGAVPALLIVAAGLTWAKAVFIPVVLSVLLTFILTPVVMALQRRGLRRAYAVLLVLLLTLGALGGPVPGPDHHRRLLGRAR